LFNLALKHQEQITIEMKLLIIEDEQDLLDLMLRYLKREGYVCESTNTFNEGYKKINNYEYDCAVIDLNLPGGDGLKLVNILREDNTEAGIVIISARDTVDDRISGLEIGADDYLTKPFNLSELNARIKAVLRRKTNQFIQ
jgi:DNA-binding response OmpR family regulator